MSDTTSGVARAAVDEARADAVGGEKPAIRLRHVTRRFGRRTVVDDVSLDCPAGSLTGLIGLNGAGKSTLLRTAVGLIAPTDGTSILAGYDAHAEPVEIKRKVGYVPDRPNIYGWMTTESATEFVAQFHEKFDWQRCGELVKRFRLPMTTKVKHLSKGQAAKLQLLLAVCHDPDVLILDEPTGGFDPIVREEFFQSVLEIATSRGRTVLLSSHALADMQRLADRIALMHDGQLILSGTTDEILGRVKRVRVVLDDGTPAPPVPPDVLRQTRDGREWLITVDRFGPTTLDGLRDRPGVRLDVMDLTLDDVFKDVVRGREEAES